MIKHPKNIVSLRENWDVMKFYLDLNRIFGSIWFQNVKFSSLETYIFVVFCPNLQILGPGACIPVP